MEEHYNSDDTFLARWLAGELSKEERIAFEKTKAYKQFRIINEEVQKLEGPKIDTEAALKQVKFKIKALPKKAKVIRLWYTVAASIVILISLGIFLNSSKTYTTAIGEKQIVMLQDGSVINLNANSSISHKRFFWMNNRDVKLTGEGYFAIKNGDDFIVTTSKGKVSVLGTEFNIKDRSYFELKCYEGKVQFTELNNTAKAYTLTKGMQLNLDNEELKEYTFQDKIPSWKTGISTFSDQPISKVLEELTYIYPITFDVNNTNTNRLFTGSFTHKDLNTALQTTLVPMGIKYKKATDSNVIMLSE